MEILETKIVAVAPEERRLSRRGTALLISKVRNLRVLGPNGLYEEPFVVQIETQYPGARYGARWSVLAEDEADLEAKFAKIFGAAPEEVRQYPVGVAGFRLMKFATGYLKI